MAVDLAATPAHAADAIPVATPVPLKTWERAAAASFGGIRVFYHFGSGNYIRTVVRKYFIRVKYQTFIILNTWE
ncbi:hypothetical protein HanXRQr2_Chr11g0514591 [Helianthus annuus]|uniref:Uncharacterized protein n=1 Tax=Helianthus annuus TaxID=4232 RepID=A0A251SRD1_HELAN|nr:hypothetical protein HanXRQr2_Chr11g0514591 [Helianthus annuus]KAJ0877073.1 hypothetical protein HanPSC8_Chr11g0495911 [Helianthus annuus]